VEPSGDAPGTVTVVLEELRQGTPGAHEELFRIVYGELKALAAARMRRQPSDHTLQPTALVNEAYLRLMGTAAPDWRDRSHFFASAARAMRSILVDFARRRGALKRGGDRERISLHEDRQAATDESGEILAVHEALDKLERIDPVLARVVELRFFGGLSVPETAAVLEVAERTVYRHWNQARAWLYREIRL
jgi:RNA polymerase sigma factor (TIGR02999 family)